MPLTRTCRFLALLAVLAPLTGAAAQSAHPHSQPYAGLQDRAVKALSEEQIADLRRGRGMGLALPAELNGYPGPVHVLEHAEALALTEVQKERTQKLFDAMTAEAVPLGERLIHQEIELDRLFATKSVQSDRLEAATAAIGATQGALRAAHLRYHLAMMDLLTPDQVRRYAELRGYAGGHGGAAHSGRAGHGSHGGKGAH
jgi:Spy/CpxP family protein refolding chaperone